MDRVRYWAKKLGMVALIVVALLAFVSAVILLFRIIWAPTGIGTPATESEALIRANERMVDMVKWTISTVIVVGGLFVGINWYQSERRYQADRSSDTQRINAIEARIQELLDQQGQLHHDRKAIEDTLQRAQRLLDYLDVANGMNSADRFIEPKDRLSRLLAEYGDAEHDRRRKIAVYVSESLSREFQSILNRVIQERDSDAPTFRSFQQAVSSIELDFPSFAQEIRGKLNQIRTLAAVAPRQSSEQPPSSQ